MLIAVRNMREVVEELRREDSEALLELREFDHAMAAMLRQLTALDGALRELCMDVAALAGKEASQRLEALPALVVTVYRVHSTSEQIARAFEMFQSAVSAWGAAETTP